MPASACTPAARATIRWRPTFRLYTRAACDNVAMLLVKLQQSLVALAEQNAETILPGFTHLQVAMPVTLGHHLMAYVEMFARDHAERMLDCRKRVNRSPLGAPALAGTTFPIDREMTAKALGFDASAATRSTP